MEAEAQERQGHGRQEQRRGTERVRAVRVEESERALVPMDHSALEAPAMKLQTLELAVSDGHIDFNLIGLRSYRGGDVSLAINFAKQFDDLDYADTDQRLRLLQQSMD